MVRLGSLFFAYLRYSVILSLSLPSARSGVENGMGLSTMVSNKSRLSAYSERNANNISKILRMSKRLNATGALAQPLDHPTGRLLKKENRNQILIQSDIYVQYICVFTNCLRGGRD